MRTKFVLDLDECISFWYNVLADRHEPLPPALHPGIQKLLAPEDLAPLFPLELIRQEVSIDRWIEIPKEIQKIFKLWRSTDLPRAFRLEDALDTPAKIFYKYEGTSPPGSHKPNPAVATLAALSMTPVPCG